MLALQLLQLSQMLIVLRLKGPVGSFKLLNLVDSCVRALRRQRSSILVTRPL